MTDCVTTSSGIGFRFVVVGKVDIAPRGIDRHCVETPKRFRFSNSVRKTKVVQARKSEATLANAFLALPRVATNTNAKRGMVFITLITLKI